MKGCYEVHAGDQGQDKARKRKEQGQGGGRTIYKSILYVITMCMQKNPSDFRTVKSGNLRRQIVMVYFNMNMNQ